MKTEGRSAELRDVAARPRTWVLVWGLPATVLVVSFFLAPTLRVVLWPLCLVWMGAACLANAVRCGRMHCYFTGPFFLLAAGASLLHGLELVSFGPHGWRWLGITLAVGAIVLHYLPEWIWGKYVSSTER
ncbi:MAG: hypothetical protein ACE5LB_05895 [Acidiferrobacterales bacterium]